MTTKRFIQKIDNDKKLNKLLEEFQAGEEAERVEKLRLEEEGASLFVGTILQPEKSVGQLTVEAEYFEYVAPILKDLEEHRKAKMKIVNKAKEEYEEKTKDVLEELKQLRTLENDLFNKGGNINHFNYERYHHPIGGKRYKPSEEIALEIASLATTKRDIERDRLAILEVDSEEAL